jgi:hypothetical protein
MAYLCLLVLHVYSLVRVQQWANNLHFRLHSKWVTVYKHRIYFLVLKSNRAHYCWGHYRPIVSALDDDDDDNDDDCGAVGGMLVRRNQSTWRKPTPVPLCSHQISHDVARDGTQTAKVGSRQLTSWATTRPRPELLQGIWQMYGYTLWYGKKWPVCRVHRAMRLIAEPVTHLHALQVSPLNTDIKGELFWVQNSFSLVYHTALHQAYFLASINYNNI